MNNRRTNSHSTFWEIILIFSLIGVLSPSTLLGLGISPGNTSVTTSPIDRFGPNLTTLSVTFTDSSATGVGGFNISFKLRAPYEAAIIVVADSLTHGQSGMTVIDNGDSTFTASIDYDPPNDAILGLYDLHARVYNGTLFVEDSYENNLDELQITNGGENTGPVVQSDATWASPAGVLRIGTAFTTLSASFIDSDAPPVTDFRVTFKLRDTNNVSEIVIADNVADGAGASISDLGGGTYNASTTWNPPDGQNIGHYDLYFHVTDGTADTSYDGFSNNLDELEVYDAISNNAPVIVAGTTLTLPTSVNRIGSEFTMIKSIFSDQDIPGKGAFTITIRLRDQSAIETTIVNSARHKQQGLRVRHISGGTYEATVLWDPPDTQTVGTYDLYFYVVDDSAASAVDGYASNADELTVTSSAILGDGNLLHRTNDAANCGGPNSACHDLSDHQAQDCTICHTPHATPNIYLVRDTIQTPNSGPKEVIFKTLGIGDPYNDPDPVVGDPLSGVMADDQDGVFTGVCEVCHTTTTHHRNDGSQPQPGHNNAAICVDCHTHTDGFAAGESNGGVACSCHADILTGMDSTSIFHRHVLANNDANYSPGTVGMYTIKNCLTCHVDHDIFRPDLNPGIGQRGSNLRISIDTIPVQGSSTVLSNSDYSSTGVGGICISCHSGIGCACHSAHLGRAASNPIHVYIDKVEYDSAVSTHNYTVPSAFSTDGSGFQANCVKCHNDNSTRQYQSSLHTFSAHSSDNDWLIAPLGLATPTSPLEEEFCYQCHSTTSNPNAGSNLDYYGVKSMGVNGPLDIEADMGRASAHPVGASEGVHVPGEDPATMPRHVECTDCHNPHAATADQPPSPALSGALYGADGIDTSGAIVDPVAHSYEVCFKCHGDQNSGNPVVGRDDGSTNTRLEFHPASLSFHPVTDTGTNTNSPSLIPPWTENSMMTCEDCHASSGGTSSGPHGSTVNPILRLEYVTGSYVTESATNYALCYDCHDRNSILGDNSFKKHNKHIISADAPCSVCHDPHGINSVGAGSGTHLISFDTSVATPVMGRLEFIDNGQFSGRCYVNCHNKKHNPKSY